MSETRLPNSACNQIQFRHVPVLTREVIRYLDCQPGMVIVDCTVGGAGHGKEILNRILPGGTYIGMDRDPDAIRWARQVLAGFFPHVHLIHGNYSELSDHLAELGIHRVDGILADLGVSLYQLESAGRGFSFRQDQPLNMRMDGRTDGLTAGELVNTVSEEKLSTMFREYGEERWARRIARQIVRKRRQKPILTSRQLADLVVQAVPMTRKPQRIHPATRVFMALRIAVNQELEHLTRFMEQAVDMLTPTARLCVISFHSLEDRIVKHHLRALEKGCTCPGNIPVCICGKKSRIKCITRKPIRPTDEEIAANPMARSALLRVGEKLPET